MDIAQASQVGQQFATFYYQLIDSGGKGDACNLYFPNAIQTYESHQNIGKDGIDNCYKNLKFQTISHSATTIDCHPLSDGVLIVVIGQLKADNDPPLGFSQTFVIKPCGPSNDNWLIASDIFRLTLHHFA